jgi:hypothetical protein
MAKYKPIKPNPLFRPDIFEKVRLQPIFLTSVESLLFPEFNIGKVVVLKWEEHLNSGSR